MWQIKHIVDILNIDIINKNNIKNAASTSNFFLKIDLSILTK